jgi:hypothetical protein
MACGAADVHDTTATVLESWQRLEHGINRAEDVDGDRLLGGFLDEALQKTAPRVRKIARRLRYPRAVGSAGREILSHFVAPVVMTPEVDGPIENTGCAGLREVLVRANHYAGKFQPQYRGAAPMTPGGFPGRSLPCNGKVVRPLRGGSNIDAYLPIYSRRSPPCTGVANRGPHVRLWWTRVVCNARTDRGRFERKLRRRVERGVC